MATSLYPAFTGPQQPIDPNEALQSLLAGQYQPPAPQTTQLYGGTDGSTGPSVPSGSTRNNAVAQVLRSKYGLGADVGDISQNDLQSLDEFMRSGALSDKISAEGVPAQVKGDYGMKEAALKDTGETTREKMKGESAANVAGIQNVGKVEAVQAKGGTGFAQTGGDTTSGPDAIAFWAQQDPGTWSKLPAQMRQAVAMKRAESGGDVNILTTQTRQMSEMANDLLPQIDSLKNQAQNLQSQGLFNLASSPLRQWLVGHGAGTMMGVGPNEAAQAGEFQTKLGFFQDAVKRAITNARGSGNNAAVERYNRLMNASGDLPTFMGEMDGTRDMLTPFATHTNSAVSSGTAADPYANPNYTPR